MFDDVIKFRRYTSDLERTAEYWQSDSYSVREEKIIDAIIKLTDIPPSANMYYIKEGSFLVKDETTLEQLIILAAKMRSWLYIDCFQISIDRKTNMAHMLFDWNDRTTGKSLYINRSEQIALSVLIIRYLDLPRPESADLWLRYFLVGEYTEDPKVFTNLLERLKDADLGDKNYRLARDVLTYITQMCEGKVK